MISICIAVVALVVSVVALFKAQGLTMRECLGYLKQEPGYYDASGKFRLGALGDDSAEFAHAEIPEWAWVDPPEAVDEATKASEAAMWAGWLDLERGSQRDYDERYAALEAAHAALQAALSKPVLGRFAEWEEEVAHRWALLDAARDGWSWTADYRRELVA